MLRPAPLPIQFAGGIETKQDAKQVPATKLLDLQNATFIRATTLAKRNGYRALGQQIEGSGKLLTDGVGLATRGTELVQFSDSGHAYSYRAGTDSWSDTGGVSSVIATGQPIARTGTVQSTPDIADNGGVRVCAWEDSRGGVWCSVLDAASGRSIQAQVQLDALGQRPRCVPVGTVLAILWVQPSTSRIYSAVVNPALPLATITPQIVTEDLDATAAFDAVGTFGAYSASTDNPALVAWSVAAGYRLGYLAPSGFLGSPVNGYPAVITINIGVAKDASPVAVAYTRAGGTWTELASIAYVQLGSVMASLFDPQLNDVSDFTSPTSVSNAHGLALTFGAENSGSNNELDIWFAVDKTGGGTDDTRITTMGGWTNGGTALALSNLRGHGLASRAWFDGSHVYALAAAAFGFFPYLAAVRISENAAAATPVVARLSPGEASGLPSRSCVASVVPNGRMYTIATSYRLQLSSSNGDQFGEQGIRAFALDFDADTGYRWQEFGRGLYLSSANPTHYDGATWAEAEFHCAPDVALGATISATPSSGGALTASGTYGYRLCYEAIDANGELHQGAASVPVVVNMGASQGTVTLQAPTLRLTGRPRVRLGVYRSLVNAAEPYYRVSSVNPTATGPNGYVLNDPTVDTVSFVDTMSDAIAATKEPLYTNGGILSNDPSPWGGNVIGAGKSRLFWTDPTDRDLVRYSQQREDETALESSAALSVRIDPLGGDIVAIGVMDDAVFPIRETAIHVFAGPGPDADGGQATQDAFSPPSLLTSDVGCKSPASVCQSPLGIVFQSSKGIMLLGRDRQVVSIGDPVYAYNDQTITRATLLPDRKQIVFLTDAGRTLLYDYEHQQWSTYTNHAGHDAVVLDGVYHYLRTDGRVFQETIGEYADDGAHIPMRIDTAWIKAAGYLQGWQRILWALFLGAYKSSHTLDIRIRYDYEESWSPIYPLNVSVNFNPRAYGTSEFGSDVYGGAPGNFAYQRALHINRRCQSIMFRIEDSEPTGFFGASFELSELLLIGGVIASRIQLPAARMG